MDRKILLKFLILLTAGNICFLSAAYAETVESIDKNKIIEEMLELSGTKKQIESLPGLISSQLAGYRNRQKPEIFKILSKAMLESYEVKTMYQTVFGGLRTNFDRDHYAAFLDWLHSPLARKMRRFEAEASSVEALQKMREFSASFQYDPPSQERIALMQMLDEAVGATGLNVEMIALTNLQVYKAFETVIPEAQRIRKDDNWEENFKSNLKIQLGQPIKQSTLFSFLYIYRSVSDKELKEYIDFWNSTDGRWCNKVFSQAILDAMAEAGREMGSKLAEALPAIQAAG